MGASQPNVETKLRPQAFERAGCRGRSLVSVVLLVGAMVVLLSCLGLWTSHLVRRSGVWEACDVDLPEKAGKLTFRRTGIHPFLAEYSREVVLTRADGPGIVHPLCVNTGGRTYVNVYWLRSGTRRFVRLDDAHGEYLLDVDNDQMYLVVRAFGRAFVARVESDNPFVTDVMDDDDPSTIEVKVDGRTAVPLNSLTADSTERYIGAISGLTGPLRFWSAAERPERPIDKLLDVRPRQKTNGNR